MSNRLSIDHKTTTQFWKYGIVGLSNFVVSLGVYYLLLEVLQLYYLVAFSLTWLFGVLYTFCINYLWVFKPEDRNSTKGRLLKYVIIYIVSYLLNIFLLRLVKENYISNPFIAQICILPIIVLFNFIGLKFWSLK